MRTQSLRPLLGGFLVLCCLPVSAAAQASRCRVAEVEVPALEVRVGERARLIVVFRDGTGLPCQEDPAYTASSSNAAVARIDGEYVVGVAVGQTAIAVRTTGAAPSVGAGVVVVKAGDSAAVPPPPPPMALDSPAARRATVVEPQARRPDSSAAAAPATGAAALARQPAGVAAPEALVLRPVMLTMLPGERVPLSYHFAGAGGAPARPQPLVFGATGEVTVDSLGVVSAGIRPGFGTVTARHPADSAPLLSGQVIVSVAADSVVFDRRAVTLRIGRVDTLRLSVPAQVRLLPLESRLFQYMSSDSTVVAVRPGAPILTARAPGRATIRARHVSGIGEITAAVTVATPVAAIAGPRDSVVTVVAGRWAPFAVRALTAESSAVAAPLSWSVRDATIAAVDSAAGRVRGLAAGATTLTVSTPGLSGPVARSWRIQVLAGAIDAVPARLGLAPGAVGAVGAWFRGAEQRVPSGEVQWSATGEAATTSPAGELRAIREGRARITARTAWDSVAVADVFVVPPLLLLLRRDDANDLFTGDPAALAALRKLPGEPLERVAFAWSPDRTRVAFIVRAGRGRSDLYVMDADGGGVRRLTTDSAEVKTPVFVPPDGERIVFVSTRTGRPQLYSIRVDGTQRAAIATPRPAAAPALSPDGRHLAYASDGLYEVGVDGSGERRLTTVGRDAAPRYTPDGRVLLFLRDEGARTRRLYRLALAGGTPAPMTPDGMTVDDYDVNPAGDPLLCLVVSSIGRSSITPSLGFVGADGRFTRATLGRSDEALGCRFRL